MSLLEFVEVYQECCVNDIPCEELLRSFDDWRHLMGRYEDEIYSMAECEFSHISLRFQNGKLDGTMFEAYSAGDRVYWPIKQLISYSELSAVYTPREVNIENLL